MFYHFTVKTPIPASYLVIFRTFRTTCFLVSVLNVCHDRLSELKKSSNLYCQGGAEKSYNPRFIPRTKCTFTCKLGIIPMILGSIYYVPQKGFFLMERENLTPEKPLLICALRVSYCYLPYSRQYYWEF